MQKCPVCGSGLVACFTKSQRSSREAVMLKCEHDSRHFRAFINDPQWCEMARRMGEPMTLLMVNPDQS